MLLNPSMLLPNNTGAAGHAARVPELAVVPLCVGHKTLLVSPPNTGIFPK